MVAGNIRISAINKNVWDSSTLLFSSENINFPAGNTKERPYISEPWQSDGFSGSEYVGISGTAINIRAVFFFGHNASGNVYFQGSNDNFSTTPLNQLLIKSAKPGYCCGYYFDDFQTYDYFRVITDTEPGTGYFQIGRAWAGDYIEERFAFNNIRKPVDRSIINIGPSGVISTIQKERIWTEGFLFLTLQDNSAFYDFLESCGNSLPLVCSTGDQNGCQWGNYINNTRYANLQSHSGVTHVRDNIYSASIQLSEEL
jgi:hypothetical protein